MTHNSSDDAGVPYHSTLYNRHGRVWQGFCFTLFVVSERVQGGGTV